MKAVVLSRFGAPLSILSVEDVPLPTPDPGELLVRVRAAALNPVDYKIAQGSLGALPLPRGLGCDLAGEVVRAADPASRWRPGARVAAHVNLGRGSGAFAEYTLVSECAAFAVPDDVSFADAAAFPCAGLTAYQSLFRRVHVQAGDDVLVIGGAGGVGGYAVQLAKYAGARVIATASHNADYVRRLGADYVIDYTTEDVAHRVSEITGGRGVDVVIETAGRESATATLKMLAFGGHLVCICDMPDAKAIVDHDSAFAVHQVFLGGAYRADAKAKADLGKMGSEMIELVKSGAVKSMIERRLDSLEKVPQSLEDLAGRHVFGKIIVELL